MIKYFVIRNFRVTCSSVGMLKGYMVRERLGRPALDKTTFVKSISLKVFIGN